MRFQLRRFRHAQLEQIPYLTSQQVALLALRRAQPPVEETLAVRAWARYHPHKGGQWAPGCSRRHFRVVPGQRAGLLQLSHPLIDRRRAQPNSITQLLIAQASVVLEVRRLGG